MNLSLLRSSEELYDDYSTHVLSIDFFKMSEREYNIALKGMPLSQGNCLFNTQILLQDKIGLLR